MRYYLGLAANYAGEERWRHLFAVGRERDCDDLREFLGKKYDGQAILCKNGRSGLALALKAYFEPGEAVIVNGFTCYAVYEAVKEAGLVPVWADISRESLNFDADTLESAFRAGPADFSSPKNDGIFGGPLSASSPARKETTPRIAGIIIQNSLGNPVDMGVVEKFAKKHKLVMIEDLAHCAGAKYPDGRECGTVGAATVLSFGKEKSIDTVSGGAVVLRDPCKHEIEAPSKTPKPSDHLRARFYPVLGALCRGLSVVHLGGALMRGLLRIHWVEKSADNRLDLERKISKFEAKLALIQLKELRKSGEPPLREFYLVRDREEVLKKLADKRYYLSGFWYERPVSPERYYQKVHFPEEQCPVATEVAKQIVNLPNYYSRTALAPARKIIKEYLVGEDVKKTKKEDK